MFFQYQFAISLFRIKSSVTCDGPSTLVSKITFDTKNSGIFLLFLAFYFFVQTSCEFSFETCNQVFDVNTNVDLGLKFSCSTSQPTKILDISHISSSLESVEQNIIKMNIVCCPTSPWTYNEQMEHLSCFLCFYRSSRP